MKDPSIIPFGFRPGTPEFDELLRGAPPEFAHKFRTLAKLSQRAQRAEVGSTIRLVDPVFRDPSFLKRCRGGFGLGQFLQAKGTLIVERGDASEDVTRTIMGGINLLAAEHCESRAQPIPPVRIYLDECTNARTAGAFEERKAGETRKAGLSWVFMCQWPNFPNGPEGF